jgi:hypothetical protein
MRELAVLILVVATAIGCNKKESSQPRPTPAVAEPTAPTETRSPPADIATERVAALLDAWLAAQNEGDFAAYRKLYARKFQGVKRVGDRVTRHARDGWLADRERMFARPMTVEARDPVISSWPRSATVAFTQRWASGKFEDLGPKKLLVVLEDGELRIAREEMLRSQVISSARNPAASSIELGFVLELEGASYLILDGATPPAVEKEPRLLEGSDEPKVAMIDLTDPELPAALADRKGDRVRVDDDCVAEITGFVVISRVVPHFGTVQDWNGGIDPDDPRPPASPAEIARSVFEMGEQVVGARLSACSGRWAVPAGAPRAVQAEKVTDDKLVARALAAFARTPEVIGQQDRYDGDGKWWDGADVKAFRHPRSGEVLVSVAAREGEGCGQFEAASWVLYRVVNGRLEQLQVGSPPLNILEALDLDGDGRLELIVEADGFGTELALVDPEDGAIIELRYAYHDCPC